jgi:hypothetical protein
MAAFILTSLVMIIACVTTLFPASSTQFQMFWGLCYPLRETIRISLYPISFIRLRFPEEAACPGISLWHVTQEGDTAALAMGTVSMRSKSCQQLINGS